jgi:hypothetical protein
MPNKLFIFHDPHLTSNVKYAKALYREMIRQKIKKVWLANGVSSVLGMLIVNF